MAEDDTGQSLGAALRWLGTVAHAPTTSPLASRGWRDGETSSCDVIVVQTCDAAAYAQVFQVTSRVTLEFCRRWDLAFEPFVGRKRGNAPWHACFNRIVMLQDMVDRGERGWAFCLDADAIITDLSFDLRAYLASHREDSAILVPSCATGAWWDVGTGVCFFNLGHAQGRALIGHWWEAFMALDLETLEALEPFGVHDQMLLQAVLRDRPTFRPFVFLETQDRWNAPQARFVKHLPRGDGRAPHPRLEWLSALARATVGETDVAPVSANASVSYELTIVQTADPLAYSRMLQVTSAVTFAYCRQWDIRFECFLGRKRGSKPWHATFNRVLLLAEMIDRGERGWVLFLDADSLIADLTVDLRAYLADKEGCAAILAPSGATEAWWDVNVGVGLFNLGHARMQNIISSWRAAALGLDEDRLAAVLPFELGDQELFHNVLRADASLQAVIRFESKSFLNSPHASFVQHVVRADADTLSDRIAHLANLADDVLRKGGEPPLA